MSIHANVLLCKNEFIAELSDGRKIEQADLHALSVALHGAGVQAKDMHCDWRTGHRLMTAGQQVAMQAEMRKLERAERNEAPAAKERAGIALAA